MKLIGRKALRVCQKRYPEIRRVKDGVGERIVSVRKADVAGAN